MKEETIFQRIKSAKNESPWTREFFEKNQKNDSMARLWISATSKKELLKLKENFRGHNLWIGYPDNNFGKKGIVNCSIFNGRRLSGVYCRIGKADNNLTWQIFFIR